jgi:glutathione S-transferase
MAIEITAFESSPDRGQGLARDMPVRWALEEVGQDYSVRLQSFAALKGADHRARQPFGQIPTLQDGDVALFESGAIVLHIGSTWPGLLPAGLPARARAIAWIFAAVSSVEPLIVERETAGYLERDQAWFDARNALLGDRIRRRLSDVSVHLGARDWLEDEFTAGDLMMVSVLRRLKNDSLLSEPLARYVARAEARPAFGRAFHAQKAVFLSSQSGRTLAATPS